MLGLPVPDERNPSTMSITSNASDSRCGDCSSANIIFRLSTVIFSYNSTCYSYRIYHLKSLLTCGTLALTSMNILTLCMSFLYTTLGAFSNWINGFPCMNLSTIFFSSA